MSIRKDISCILCLFSIVIAVSLNGCATQKKPPYPTTPAVKKSIEDIRKFPQDLEYYANGPHKDIPILDKAEQAYLESRYNEIFFGPWHMSRTSINKNDVSAIMGRARGYKYGDRQWSQAEWEEMEANAAVESFPRFARYAITLRNTDLREMPTKHPRFSEPTFDVRANPFDYFQYSMLPVGTPLLVAHTTLDEQWHYVECPVAGGWVHARDIVFVDDEFRQKWQSCQLAALVRDGVALSTGDGSLAGKGDIGAILPISKMRGSMLDLLIPVRNGDGWGGIRQITLSRNDAMPKPLPMTPANVAKIGNSMMGQPYGWGGMLGNRDCSALTRDLFAPFGIWLPRNSRAQARAGSIISLEGLAAEAKEKIILQSGVPFLSLVGMNGHITLYVGQYRGRPAIFHNVWGVRTIEDGNDNARLVIGKAVVTSITPGREVDNLYRPVTFVDRLRTLTTPGKISR